MVSDIRMAALTGFQLIRKVKDLRPEMKVITMIIFEVNKPEFEVIFPSTPINAAIRKPFTASQLLEEIRGSLGVVTQETTRRMYVHSGNNRIPIIR